MKPTRIAFMAVGSEEWMGGFTYQYNLLEALRRFVPEVEIYIVARQRSKTLDESCGYVSIDYPSPQASGIWGLHNYFLNGVARRVLARDIVVNKAIRAKCPEGVDVVFPDYTSTGKDVARLGWVPDFQHLHLPQMYTTEQLRQRDQAYMRMIRRSTLVVLSSEDARHDYERFAPDLINKARVMNFVSAVPPMVYEVTPQEVVDTYHLPAKFLYLPNQFWKHKNHTAVLQALHLLKQDGIEPFVVCTGTFYDNRNPGYVADLMQKISQLGLRDQIAILGLVPFTHVYTLARQAVRVLNPSLFEGWSTTVEEAKSLGKKVILSDLPVHREQNPPGARYFDPKSPDALATEIAAVWNHEAAGPDLAMEAEARTALPGRMQAYAQRFLSIVEEAIQIAR